MKWILSLLLIFTIQSIMVAQPFSELLVKLNTLPENQRTVSLDSYFLNHPTMPVIESGGNVYFIYKGEAESVSIAGDATAWSPGLPMTRIEGTTYWYCTTNYEPDARLEYKIVVNGKDWILDPLNPIIIQGGMGPNSELLMPEYQQPLFTNERDAVPWGTYSDTVLQSKIMGEQRKLRIYLPPKYDKSSEKYPVAFFHDGFQFFDLTDIRDIMDNMIYEGKMSPIIAVFVEPVKRDDEYSGNLQKKFTQFMMEELIPFIDKSYRTQATAASRAQFGISNGGNIALWLVASHPEKTAVVAAFSSNVESKIPKAIKSSKCAGVKFYLDLGKYDIPFLMPLVRDLKSVLQESGCTLRYNEYPEGHNWKFWQKHLPEALEYLFPG
ncbi:MAG: hypothetical protein IPH88_10625 [Bacteroidales bacterium]|nr:hypothetical protein [Bacteroidales bacterium]